MMFKLCLITALALFNTQCLAKSKRNTEKTECIKDLLLIVDTSYSITRTSFVDYVKPFLRRLVKHRYLNVGRYGTQFGLILFGQPDRTKLMLPFGQKFNAKDIAKYIGNLNWNDVRGYHTRTDLALKIANEDVFTKRNPASIRKGVQDVILLVTDGAPTKFTETKRYAQLLKNKDILIIGAAVGPKRKQFKHQLEQLATSRQYTVEADFKKLDDIIVTLVTKSCTLPPAYNCKCPKTASATIFVSPADSKATFFWPKPTVSCQNDPAPDIKSDTVQPEGMKSPHRFPVGNYTITYTFKLNGGVTVKCPVDVTVKRELCGRIAFSPRDQQCCCGRIYQKKANYDCCGQFYYNTLVEKCCPNANVVFRKNSCP